MLATIRQTFLPLDSLGVLSAALVLLSALAADTSPTARLVLFWAGVAWFTAWALTRMAVLLQVRVPWASWSRTAESPSATRGV